LPGVLGGVIVSKDGAKNVEPEGRMAGVRHTTDHMSIGKIAFASSVGTTIEWYDFFLYGTVTPLVFSKLFFPTFDPIVGTLLAYTTFFVGFISRPIGGIVFGHYGDRIGRKNVLVLSLLIMGVATFLIGCLPTYEQIGLWAAVLLLVLRVFQGVGIGGEWGGAVLLAIEHSPEGRRGFYGSWPQAGVPAALCLSSGVVFGLNAVSETGFLVWGWRVAFLISAVLVVIGLYIRLKILETPAFAAVKEAHAEVAVPFLELVQNYPKNVFLGMGARYIEGVAFNIYAVFIVAYITGPLAMPRSTALLGIIIASVGMLVMLPVYGHLSDRFGRRAVFAFGALGVAALTFPAFWLMESRSELLIWIAVAIPLGIVFPAIYGPEAALFSELFDTRVRYSGVSFVYQFSGIFASGLTPLIATELLRLDGKQPWLICAYVVVVALISACCVWAMSETARRGLATGDSAVDGAIRDTHALPR